MRECQQSNVVTGYYGLVRLVQRGGSPYRAGDENNMDEDSVASILGKLKHNALGRWVLTAGQRPCKSRLWAWGDFWLFVIDLPFFKSATLRSGKENSSVLVPPRCVGLMPPRRARGKRLRHCASSFSAHLHPCSSCFTLLVKGWGKKVDRNRKEDAG